MQIIVILCIWSFYFIYNRKLNIHINITFMKRNLIKVIINRITVSRILLHKWLILGFWDEISNQNQTVVSPYSPFKFFKPFRKDATRFHCRLFCNIDFNN